MAIGEYKSGILTIDTHLGLVRFTALEAAPLIALVAERASKERLIAYIDEVLGAYEAEDEGTLTPELARGSN